MPSAPSLPSELPFTKPISNTWEVKQMAFSCILKAIINYFCYTKLNVKLQSVSTGHFSDSNQDTTTYICPSPASHTSIHCFFVACLCRTEHWEIQIAVLSSQDLNYNKLKYKTPEFYSEWVHLLNYETWRAFDIYHHLMQRNLVWLEEKIQVQQPIMHQNCYCWLNPAWITIHIGFSFHGRNLLIAPST